MLNDVATKWVKALRSGEYKQGKGQLCETHPQEGNQHCCLGVLADLAVKAGVLSEFRYSFYLDETTQKWCGLADSAGSFKSESEEEKVTSLSWLNDRGKTFEQIADIIESEPEGLFLCATK
jgi:hypothetical protein